MKIITKTSLYFFSLFLLLFILQLHNLLLFPVNRGFDALDHLSYINFLKINHRLPLANEGWELYQPPMYYLISSIFSKPEYIRYLNFIMWIIISIFSYYFFKKIFKNDISPVFGTIITISLPVIIYLTPTISNEFFSGILISLTLMYYVINRNKFNLYDQIITGSLLGLSLLSKATAFVLLISISIDLFIIHYKKLNIFFKKIIFFLIIVFIISSWFYIRNIIIFSNPFISSIDFPKYAIHQTPGYRDLKFYTDVSGFIDLDLFKAHHYSLWPGTYFSWFYDGHNVIVPVQQFSKAGAVLVISSLPIFLLFIFGYVKELKAKKIKYILLIYPLLIFIAYIAYNIKLPFYSTVKGAFIVSAIIPFAYFTVQSIGLINKKYYPYIFLYLFIYVLLILKNFWILNSWYN